MTKIASTLLAGLLLCLTPPSFAYKLTRADATQCSKAIAEFQPLALKSLRDYGHEACGWGKPTPAEKAECLQRIDADFQQSMSENSMDWFIKGNESCSGPEFPCYGISQFDSDNQQEWGFWESYFRDWASKPPLAPDASGDFVNQCLAKVFLPKVDGESADRGEPASQTVSAPSDGTVIYAAPIEAPPSEPMAKIAENGPLPSANEVPGKTVPGTERGSSPTPPTSEATQSVAEQNSQAPASHDDESGNDGNKIWSGVQNRCVTFKADPPPKDGIANWYTYSNGCEIPLKVCDNMSGRGWGCGIELKPHGSDRNWNSPENVARNGGTFVACDTELNGKQVFLDKKALVCFRYK